MNRLINITGLPGSGKTTLAKLLAQELGGEEYAADDYFTNGGVYNFDPAKLARAHGWCQSAVDMAFAYVDTVIVHNTGSRKWEREEYKKIARARDAEYTEIYVNSGLSDEELAERNVHRVPIDVIKKMRERWEF